MKEQRLCSFSVCVSGGSKFSKEEKKKSNTGRKQGKEEGDGSEYYKRLLVDGVIGVIALSDVPCI